MEVGDFKNHLSGVLHGADLDKVQDIELVMERAANTMLQRIDPIETIRTAALSSAIYDDVYNYALPTDYKDIIDLAPEDNRTLWDKMTRNSAGRFDREKALASKTLSIEGNNGTKIARINWRSRPGLVLNTLDAVTGDGAWSAVGSATGVQTDTIFHVSGGGSVRFTHVASNDGIQNTTMTAVDLTDENGVADVFVWLYFSAVPTSVTAIWGNDLTTKFWTGVAQTTQADGTALRVGWNLLKWSWSAATQTGTVAPASIDSFKITVAGTALGLIRVDNIIFSIGRNFDLKYYSKWIIQDSTGTWLSKTTNDSDLIVLDSDAIQIYTLECLLAAAQQTERQSSSVDMAFAIKELSGDPASADTARRIGLYGTYRKRYPSQAKRMVRSYAGLPRLNRGLGRP